MQPVHAAQALGEQHEAVLQVALTPAAFALGVFNHSLRSLLVAPFKIVSEPDLPVFPRQQRGLDEIMAQNITAEWLSPGQLRQVAELHERFGADEGVVSPIISQI